MSATQHPLAPHTLPWFITSPGDTDMLYVITTVVVVIAVMLLGVFFFWLHSLPERMGHKKLQFEVVAILGLISLFTHQHIFWIIGLLLAVIDLPDFTTPLGRIADAAETMVRKTRVMPSAAEESLPASAKSPVTRTSALEEV